MHKVAHRLGAASPRNFGRQFLVHMAKCRHAAMQDGDQVDYRIHAGGRLRQRCLVMHIAHQHREAG